MPRRVNLTILLGLVIIAVFSFGLSAAAQPRNEGNDERHAEPGDGIDAPGGEAESASPLDPPEELKELAQDAAQASAAEGAYKNALFEERELNDKIARTRQDLAGAEKNLEEAQGEFDTQASQMYKRGRFGFLDLLLGAENLQEFQELAGLSMQLLNGQRDEVEKWRDNKAVLEQKKEDLETQLENRKEITAEEEAKFDAAQSALKDAQDRRDSLDPEAHEKIEDWEARQAERARELIGRLGAEPSLVHPEMFTQEEGTTEEPVAGSVGGDETQARLLAALGGETPAQGDTEEKPAAEIGETPIPHLATDVAEKQAEADRQAKEAAELAADEQEARREAEGQNAALKEAKLAVARAPGAEQPDAQTNADEIDRQAKLAAEEAAAKGSAAKEAADRAVEKGADADKAKQNLFVVGKTAGQQPTVSDDTGGVVDVGTELVVHGNFSINPGSSVTFEDADGTRGTAVDGVNAKIVKGSIDTTLTGPLDNVTGGDGQLSTDGLRLVDTTGIAPDSGGVPPDSDTTGTGELQYAPKTGAGGLQYTAPALGTGGVQYAPKTGAGGLQYTTPALGGVGSQSKPVTAGQPGGPQATSSAPAASGSAVLAEGLKYLGQPYVHGGAAPGGFDCSGFTQWVYGAALGISLPDSPAAQYGMGAPVPVGTPGALIFFSEDGSGTPTHVGLDMGDGTILHASIFTGKVSITPINYITGLLGDRRP